MHRFCASRVYLLLVLLFLSNRVIEACGWSSVALRSWLDDLKMSLRLHKTAHDAEGADRPAG